MTSPTEAPIDPTNNIEAALLDYDDPDDNLNGVLLEYSKIDAILDEHRGDQDALWNEVKRVYLTPVIEHINKRREESLRAREKDYEDRKRKLEKSIQDKRKTEQLKLAKVRRVVKGQMDSRKEKIDSMTKEMKEKIDSMTKEMTKEMKEKIDSMTKEIEFDAKFLEEVCVAKSLCTADKRLRLTCSSLSLRDYVC